MEKAVIIRQLDVSIANGKQLDRLPENSGSPGNFALRYCLGNERQEAVGRMPAVENLRE